MSVNWMGRRESVGVSSIGLTEGVMTEIISTTNGMVTENIPGPTDLSMSGVFR